MSIDDNINVLKPVFKRKFHVFALKRSGQHAIIHWIARQLVGNTLHLNNPPPILHAAPNNYFNSGNQIFYYYDGGNLLDRKGSKFTRFSSQNIDFYICNFEDRVLDVYSNKYSQLSSNAKHVTGVGVPIEMAHTNVLVLRDPFNLFSSRYHHSKVYTKSNRIDALGPTSIESLDTWKDYAKQFLGEASFVNKNLVVINYNRWFSDMFYRNKICDDLEIDFTDAGVDEISPIGISSFDGMKFEGNAKKMNVLYRYKNNARLLRCLLDDETKELSEKIFGINPKMDYKCFG